MAWSRAFQIFYHFLKILFLQIFLLITEFCNINFNFCKFAKELTNDVSFVIFGHQTWDLEGGGRVKLTPLGYPGFQVP